MLHAVVVACVALLVCDSALAGARSPIKLPAPKAGQARPQLGLNSGAMIWATLVINEKTGRARVRTREGAGTS